MPYGLLADLVVVVHLLFVLYVVFGAFGVLRHPRTVWLHLPAFLWGAWVSLAGRVCPLTPLENWLRRRAGGGGGYEGSFVEQYLLPLLYPGALTREIQIGLGIGVLVLNALIYCLIYSRLRKG